MSEPTVTIPLRVALIAMGVFAFHSKKFESIQNEIIDAIADQCTGEEIDVAAVAVKMQESQFV